MRRFAWTLAIVFCLLPITKAGTKQGDQLIARARAAEDRGTLADLDQALELAVEALRLDPSDTEYLLTEARIRALTGQKHVRQGDSLVRQGKLEEALAEFEKASKIDTAPSIGRDYAKKVRAILDEMKKNPGLDPAEAGLSPLQRAERQTDQLAARMKGPAQLHVKLSQPLPILRVNNQVSAEVFTLLGKLANVRVLFDPDYQSKSLGRNQLVDLRGLTLEEALDQVALITRSFWKPVTSDTVLITNDDPDRRGLFDDEVTKVLYLSNSPTPQEAQRVGETVRNVTDIKKLLIHPDQNALVLRGDANRVTLAQKIVEDLDKPKAEIIIDVLVLSVSKDWTRDLGTSLAAGPGSLVGKLSPGSHIFGASNSNGISTIPLSAIPRLTAGDFAITLPTVAVNALLSNQTTKIVDKAQLRTVEGQRSSLRIGQRVPYATGSFAPGNGGGVSPLINTQFSFFDVGLNIDVVAKVHEPDEVSLHIESDHSSVSDYQNIGGLVQPVITQRKRVADVRVKEGEANFWDIVTERQSTRTVTGIPGLNRIPVLGPILTQTHRAESENLLLHLLIPHIIRSSDIRESNVHPVASGNDRFVRLSYSTPGEATAAPRTAPTDADIVDVVKTMDEPTPVQPPQQQALGAAPTGPAAPTAGTLAITPPNANVRKGDAINIDLQANGIAGLASGDIVIQFDPTVVRCTAVTAGALLAGASLQQTVDANLGLAAVSVKGTAAGPTGTLVTYRFEALQTGVSPISIAEYSLKNSSNANLTVTPGNGQIDVK